MDSTRTRLLEAAGQLFAERGFSATSVRDVCELAKVNIASVKYYFGDKEGMYLAAVRQAQCADSDQVPQPVWPEGTPPVQKFRDFVRYMLATKLGANRPRWHLELMLHELARPTSACSEVVRDYIRPSAEILGEILSELMPGKPWDTHGWMIGFSIVGQILIYYVHRPICRDLMGHEQFDQLSIDEISEHISNFSLAALGHFPALAKTAPPGGQP